MRRWERALLILTFVLVLYIAIEMARIDQILNALDQLGRTLNGNG